MPARRHALADLDEGGERRLGRQRQRAAKCPVLVRGADRLYRQESPPANCRAAGAYACQIRFRDVGIDTDRQMRPMLLDRGDRQHRDTVRRELFRRQGKPVGHLSLRRRPRKRCTNIDQCLRGHPAFAAERDPLWSAQFQPPEPCMSLASLPRSTLFAITLFGPCPRKRSHSTGLVRHQLGGRGRAWRFYQAVAPAPTRNTASTSPSCRAARR